MLKDFLVSPGPTQVPQAILAAMAEPIYHHRTPQFSKVFMETVALLKELFKTKNDMFLLSASGTGAMEAAVVNTLTPGDKVIVVRGGKFGERWGEIASAYCLNPVYVDVEWGNTVEANTIKNLLDKHKDTKAVLMQYSDTSTGVLYPIEEIAAVVAKSPALFIVDAITALGVHKCPVDEWKIDVVVCGSQKSLMLPPGLAFISFSENAWKAQQNSKLPKYYFNLANEKKAIQKNTTAWTPAISLIIGLNKALKMILNEEGLGNVIKRHQLIAKAAREGVKALGLQLFAKRPSNSVTAIKTPEGVDGAKIPKLMRDKYGVAIAGGQGHAKGKIFRLGHLGYIEKSDIAVLFQALEFALKDLGYEFNWGAAAKASSEVLYPQYKDFPVR